MSFSFKMGWTYIKDMVRDKSSFMEAYLFTGELIYASAGFSERLSSENHLRSAVNGVFLIKNIEKCDGAEPVFSLDVGDVSFNRFLTRIFWVQAIFILVELGK